ncbi:4-hydroxythreonine-4-phosphate dehydrogenase [invertebrate metagenome]|uniref:4-hydroxythreonine-4-phosphate dehydrogenase n=1 Tax=invertebrate metagenome TaxID=1711999 RepID=A0A484H7I7_9ZZZZ
MTSVLELPLAVTMGEPASISGEITCKAWLRRDEGLTHFFVIDDPDRLVAVSRCLRLGVPVEVITTPAEAVSVFAHALPVLPEPLAVRSVPGKPILSNARAVLASIERAIILVRNGYSAAVVTNPIYKKGLYAAVFPYSGHTEFLAALAGSNSRPVMMLTCPGLRVVPVTIHVSLRQAIARLRTADIIACGRIAARALQTDFGIAHPKLVVAALNPHAGEEGSMGEEEDTLIRPAIETLCREGITAFGPAPADTLFHPKARTGYDVVLCMYHDQALIPLKTIDFSGGVNITLGLPFVRTAPDHGTAFDIAGMGKADEWSLMQALRTARAIATHRLIARL